MLQQLPLGTSEFQKIRLNGQLYVDKTRYAYELIKSKYPAFLSRPRRFGKSLFVSTLKSLLAGEKDLFQDLWIATSDYSWQKHGVIILDISTIGAGDPETLQSGLCFLLKNIAEDYGIVLVGDTNPNEMLIELTRALHARYDGAVALLIDEYDSAILRSLREHDRAEKIREVMREFFSAVKGIEAYFRVVFVTGVSSFAKAGLFSGMNSLKNITFDGRYAGICGYSDEEVDHYFKDYVTAWAEKKSLSYEKVRGQLREFYDGYRFALVSNDTVTPLYNPFSLMNALDEQSLRNFWFQSGPPTFLIEEMAKEYRRDELQIIDPLVNPQDFVVAEDALGIFDVGKTPLISLMLQTGYLTVKQYDEDSGLLHLNYPNREVQSSLQIHIITLITRVDILAVQRLVRQFGAAMNAQNLKEAFRVLKQIFISVPYALHVPQESYYHALFQIICGAAGVKVLPEQMTSHGCIDIVLELSRVTYIIEIKFNKTPEEALKQIVTRGYSDLLAGQTKPVVLLGLAFRKVSKEFDITYAVQNL